MIPSLKKHIVEYYGKLESPFHIILFVVFISGVIFVPQIPDSYKYYGNNVFLRAIFFGLIVGICKYISYAHSLLFAIFVLLYISFTPGIKEAYEDLRIVAKKEKRWFDEQVLGEKPELMETEKVTTGAIQSS